MDILTKVCGACSTDAGLLHHLCCRRLSPCTFTEIAELLAIQRCSLLMCRSGECGSNRRVGSCEFDLAYQCRQEEILHVVGPPPHSPVSFHNLPRVISPLQDCMRPPHTTAPLGTFVSALSKLVGSFQALNDVVE